MPCFVLKRLKPECTGNTVYRRALAREASILALLDRPGLPHLVAADVDAEQAWLRYRWRPGHSIAMYGRGAGVGLAHSVARGLLGHVCYLHNEVRCVHGDIAASNVVLSCSPSSAKVSLLDFGNAWRLASPWRRRPQSAYRAPEQAAGKTWSRPADIFQVGVVVHEVLAGARPDTRSNTPPETPIPVRWRQWLSMMLDPVAENRPDAQTAHDLVPNMRDHTHGPCVGHRPLNMAASGQMEAAG